MTPNLSLLHNPHLLIHKETKDEPTAARPERGRSLNTSSFSLPGEKCSPRRRATATSLVTRGEHCHGRAISTMFRESYLQDPTAVCTRGVGR